MYFIRGNVFQISNFQNVYQYEWYLFMLILIFQEHQLTSLIAPGIEVAQSFCHSDWSLRIIFISKTFAQNEDIEQPILFTFFSCAFALL